jgi:hypothetical protein
MLGIWLRCKVFPGAFLLYLCKPRCSIDGGPEQILRWGENVVAVPPGRHSLRVWYRYVTGPTNVAETVIDVPPDGLAMVYKTRWHVFLAGKLEPLGPAYRRYGQQPGPLPVQQPVHTPPVQAPPAAWNPDPSGRHQHRWWDGRQWTSAVADNVSPPTTHSERRSGSASPLVTRVTSTGH